MKIVKQLTQFFIFFPLGPGESLVSRLEVSSFLIQYRGLQYSCIQGGGGQKLIQSAVSLMTTVHSYVIFNNMSLVFNY